MKISAVIITYNEARNIGRCLDSLSGLADEVVVLDSFSTDETEQICRSKGALFMQRAFAGFGRQKNLALDAATHDWVLSLDADEALGEALRASLFQLKSQPGLPSADAFSMNRLTNYCGQWIRHCGWYPDRKLRFFNRSKARWSEAEVHEKVELTTVSTTAHLRGDLLHYSYYTVEEHYTRARKYAHLGAKTALAQGKRAGWWKLAFSPLFKFLRNYILKLGFLDGRAGLTICWISALETYWKYKELNSLKG